MPSCSGFDAKTLRESREFYNRLFGATLGWYNANVHPYVYQSLCVLGVLANVCVVVVLLRAPMRRNPFNLFLIAIAICDMTLMATYFIYKRVEMCHPWYFEYAWIVFTYAYAVLSVYVHSASLWITVNMAVLRYLVLKNSASNSSMPKLNTYAAASLSIAAALLISLIGSAPNMLRYEIRDNGMSVIPYMCVANHSAYADYYAPGQKVHAYTLGQPTFWSCTWERLSFWTAGIMLKLIPCFLLTVFMTLLVRMLMEARERRLRLCQRGSLAAGGRAKIASIPNDMANEPSHVLKYGSTHQPTQQATSSSAANAERTTAMLTIIVAVFLVTELPQGILVMTIGVQPQLHNLIDLLSLLNSSVNFILYSTMSNLFRNEFLHTFGQLCFCVRTELCCCSTAARAASPSGRRRRSVASIAAANAAGALCMCCGVSGDEDGENECDQPTLKSRLANRASKERTSSRRASTATTAQPADAIIVAPLTSLSSSVATTTLSTTVNVDDTGRTESRTTPLINGGQAPPFEQLTRIYYCDRSCVFLDDGKTSPTSTVPFGDCNVTAATRAPLIPFDNGFIDVSFDENGETVLC